METLAIVLYGLVMKDPRRPENRIVFQNSTSTPLGVVRLAGIIRQSPGAGPPARCLGSYALVYSLEGECDYWDERIGKRHIKAGDLLILFPEIAHRYRARPEGRWDEFFVVFDGPIFDQWRESGFLNPENAIFHLDRVAYWHKRIEACLETRGTVGRIAALQQICNLQSLLAEILAHPGSGSPLLPPPAWLERACDSLKEDTMQQLDLPGLARRLGISFETFRKTFTQIMGTPPSRYRAARLMERACGLMMESSLSGKEIAEKLGFSDEYHFSKRFKQVTGLTPTAFRQQMRIS